MYSEGSRTRNIWQTMLMTVTFFSEELICVKMFYQHKQKIWAQSLGPRDFRGSFTSKSGAISPQPLCLLEEDQLLLFSLLCPTVVQFHGPISSPSQQSGNKLILTAALGQLHMEYHNLEIKSFYPKGQIFEGEFFLLTRGSRTWLSSLLELSALSSNHTHQMWSKTQASALPCNACGAPDCFLPHGMPISSLSSYLHIHLHTLISLQYLGNPWMYKMLRELGPIVNGCWSLVPRDVNEAPFFALQTIKLQNQQFKKNLPSSQLQISVPICVILLSDIRIALLTAEYRCYGIGL